MATAPLRRRAPQQQLQQLRIQQKRKCRQSHRQPVVSAATVLPLLMLSMIMGISTTLGRPANVPSTALLDGTRDTASNSNNLLGAQQVSGQISFRTKTRHGVRGMCICFGCCLLERQKKRRVLFGCKAHICLVASASLVVALLDVLPVTVCCTVP